MFDPALVRREPELEQELINISSLSHQPSLHQFEFKMARFMNPRGKLLLPPKSKDPSKRLVIPDAKLSSLPKVVDNLSFSTAVATSDIVATGNVSSLVDAINAESSVIVESLPKSHQLENSSKALKDLYPATQGHAAPSGCVEFEERVTTNLTHSAVTTVDEDNNSLERTAEVPSVVERMKAAPSVPSMVEAEVRSPPQTFPEDLRTAKVEEQLVTEANAIKR